MVSEEELSNMFDVLWNNITSNQAPGLNAYEKSVFLTKSQKELVRNHFNIASKGNILGQGFDDSAVRQMDFSKLLEVAEKSPLSDATDKFSVDHRSILYELPSDVFIIVSEQILLSNDDNISVRQVIPINYNEYLRLMSKPFKEPFKWQAWRLLSNNDNKVAEIVLSSIDKEYSNKVYSIRYVRQPEPIILEDLNSYDEDLTIEGNTSHSLGELDDNTYDIVLQRAVELAKVTWERNANQTQLHITSGQRSE